MKSNYKQIGDFIRQVNVKNTEGIETLLGVNLDKKFISSVANLHGVDLSKYKVIKKGQFGCKLMSVGRDKALPISRLTEIEQAIISSAYYVFEVIDENLLHPEYLMMWFRRSESDRYLWFQSGGDIRGRITWEEFCTLPIVVPSIQKQREIVAEYNTVVNRINLNEQLNQKLEETAQALYKHWFVDFEFPNEEGKPYKSSGGKMVFNDELEKEIPVGWAVEKLDEVCLKITKGTTPKLMKEKKTDTFRVAYLKGESISSSHHIDLEKLLFIDDKTDNELRRSQLIVNDIIHGMAGSISSLEKFAIVDEEILPANTNQAVAIIRVNQDVCSTSFIYGYFVSGIPREFYKSNIQQAVQANLSLGSISSLPIILPSIPIIGKIESIMNDWVIKRNLVSKWQRRLYDLQKLMLVKMTQVKPEKK